MLIVQRANRRVGEPTVEQPVAHYSFGVRVGLPSGGWSRVGCGRADLVRRTGQLLLSARVVVLLDSAFGEPIAAPLVQAHPDPRGYAAVQSRPPVLSEDHRRAVVGEHEVLHGEAETGYCR